MIWLLLLLLLLLCFVLPRMRPTASCSSMTVALRYEERTHTRTRYNTHLGLWGSESTRYYTKCRIMQGNIPNIHVVRKSFLQLNELTEKVCTRATHGSDESWLQKLAQTLWLQNLTLIISACTTCAYYIEQKKQSVLMDSYYRTIEGIIVLIEKEWLSFGFKFKDRYGMCEKLQEKSPIFIQWLDCLHQVVIQFEHCFEYNTRFLFDIWIWSHSMWFGNFLGNSNKERLENRCAQKTISLWAMVEANKQRYVNPNYVRPSSSSASLASFPPDGGGAASKHVLMPISDWKIFKLWDVYLQHSDVFWASRGPWSATQISGFSLWCLKMGLGPRGGGGGDGINRKSSDITSNKSFQIKGRSKSSADTKNNGERDSESHHIRSSTGTIMPDI
eukprot:jgi/Bigna1/69326/fgenesh1_pg.8_\